jgi:hypothetical protein
MQTMFPLHWNVLQQWHITVTTLSASCTVREVPRPWQSCDSRHQWQWQWRSSVNLYRFLLQRLELAIIVPYLYGECITCHILLYIHKPIFVHVAEYWLKYYMENKSKICYDCNQTSRRNDCLSEDPPFESRPKEEFRVDFSPSKIVQNNH